MRELILAALGCGLFAGSALAGPLGYASTGSGQFGLVDLSNGNFTLIGSLTASLVGLGESGNVLYGLDSTGNLVTIDKTTAAATQLGNLGITATVFSSLSTGSLFAVDNSWTLWSIDPVNVKATSVRTIKVNNTALPALGGYGYANGLAGDSASLYFTLDLWSSNPGDVLTDKLYRIDPATGAATVIGPTNQEDIAGAAYIAGALYGFTGDFVSLPHKIVTLDTSTGASTFVTDVSGIASLYGAVHADPPITTPEPATASLVALALGAVLFGAVRTKRFSQRSQRGA